MSNDRKWLEGEVKFVEGKTTIKDFLKTIATEMVTQQWIPYDNTTTNKAWIFDLRREFTLHSVFKPENIKLYKATVDELTNGYIKSEEIPTSDYEVIGDVIRGIGDTGSGTEIGDFVLVEVNYEAEEFQRATFLEKMLPSREITNVASLKSRPQGIVHVFEDTIQVIEGEQLHQAGGNEIYKVARTPISDSQGTHRVVIYKNGVAVDDSEYLIDYFNGTIIFNTPNETDDLMTIDYGFKTGKRGAEISTSKYKMYTDKIIDITPTKELGNLDVIVDVDYYWELQHPSTVQEIGETTNNIVLKSTVDVSPSRNWTKTKDYYWELAYYDKDLETESYKTGIKSRFGSTLNDADETTLDDELSSEWTKWSWYREEGFEEGLIFEDWLPVRYWMNFTKEFANIVLQGDPSPDIHPYKNYIISYGYVGMLKPYDNAKTEDLDNNFAMTMSSDTIPQAEDEYATTWGLRTGTGVTDIIMERTGSNIPYQAHYPSFHASPEFMDKHFIHVSEFTGSHHFSEVTVTHAYERERGKLQGMLIGDRSSIFHLDELISNKDTFDNRGALVGGENEFKNQCGLPFKSQEKKWIMFNINAPYWFANNSPNVFYGVALRKS